MNVQLEKDYDHIAIEQEGRDLWDEAGIYRYAPQEGKQVFSVDTPPPYVSAAHLHVGHAMSYSQAEFVVRYKRMRGYNIFYPMGFDDNGLPTERYVEKTHKVDKRKISRTDFQDLCIAETGRIAKVYEKLWRDLGLSVDWTQRYSTIDPNCRRTAQLSFIDLFEKEKIYRSDEPVIWDTHFDTALAQADLEWLKRRGRLYDIRFSAPDGTPLVISTTRPELIPACVALYFNPDDERYQHLKEGEAIVPLFEHRVPIKTSPEVALDFGTGLMMVCTFGDAEDVKKWKEDKLDTRICLDRRGKMTELAGRFAGMDAAYARKQIVKDLKDGDFITGEKTVEQNVAIGERSGQPIEFAMEPQWFIRLMAHRDEFLKRADELNWHPDYMKTRLKDWINGLKYDWNISRQRFYGVPFPLWFVQETGEVILADRADLPVDPLADPPPAWAQEKYKGMTIVGDPDVMDTWMTSSLSPQINTGWYDADQAGTEMELFPMTLRVQAFEIIRTWLFYSVAKAHFHQDSLPWTDAMISGWGLNEQGKKISKRDLERFTDKNGFNRYDPNALIGKYGADALRFWAAGSHLGHDLRYHEKDVRTGRRGVIKLWNVARFATLQLENFDPSAPRPAIADRNLEDRWLLVELHRTVRTMTEHLDRYDYANARDALEKFFWKIYCDNYTEIIKDRFWNPDRFSSEALLSTQATLYEALRVVVGLFAPYLPFVTEALYQRIYRESEEPVSIHVSDWPDFDAALADDDGVIADMGKVLAVLQGVRFLRSENKISQTARLEKVSVDLEQADPALAAFLTANTTLLQSALMTESLFFEAADGKETSLEGVRVGLTPKIDQ
ncbi:MAG: valine--tRNA ligase [Magnetococcales bacterium]|nr:valine--tRNA ligase [Magnetococcales bacterium]